MSLCTLWKGGQDDDSDAIILSDLSLRSFSWISGLASAERAHPSQNSG